jgi:hypothetical protein
MERSQALVHRPAHKSQYALQKESLHLLPKHKNRIRPLQQREFRTKIGRPRKEKSEMVPLEQLTAEHTILLTTRDLRDYTRQINGTTLSEKGAALQIVMEYI